jgi:hypothetical protein
VVLEAHNLAKPFGITLFLGYMKGKIRTNFYTIQSSMSSLLRPVVLDPCQTTIRGRRRSSIHPLNTIPRPLSATSTATDECAISDDSNALDMPDAASDTKSSQFYPPPSLSPLSDAHISDYFTSTAAPRHKNSAPPLYTLDTSSPTSTLAPNLSRKTSTKSRSESSYFPSHGSMKWRLASGYFAYFLCGWGDGGKNNMGSFTLALSFFIPSPFSDRDSLALSVETPIGFLPSQLTFEQILPLTFT